MDQKEAVRILEEIALLLELKGENPFKTKAYVNAARSLELTEESLDELVTEGRLGEVKGIGKAIEEKLTELVKTGRLPYYEELRASIPEGLFEMMKIPGLGPKKVKTLYDKLEIKSLGELEYACLENRLLTLDGFGEKTQSNILKGIEHVKKYKGQFLIGDVFVQAQKIKEILDQSPLTTRCEIAGSLRRRKEVVKDIDIVATSDQAAELMAFFAAMPGVEEIIAKGETKTSVRLDSGINMDLRVVPDNEFPYVLNHFTGSKEHNTAMRHRAKAIGIKINEYGLFKDDMLIPCNSEEEIYRKLGLDYIPPELRENSGEIEAAEVGNLPQLVTLQDIRGTFHIHTHYSDGANTIQEMAEAARKSGLHYIGLADHSQSAFYAKGLKPDDVKRQIEEIDRLNAGCSDFRIFKGIESDILQDGSLDYDEDILKLFDFVIASVHSSFRLEKDKMTERLINAIKNPYTTMLGHPTGRILLARDAYALDLYAVIDAAAEYGKIIEINSDPHRLDLDWRYVKYAKGKGVRLAINPDAHHVSGFDNLDYGVGIARKGWLEKHDVVNTMETEEIAALLRR